MSKADVDETLGASQHGRGSTQIQRLIDSSFESDVETPSSHSSLASETDASEFDSNYSMRNYPIEVYMFIYNLLSMNLIYVIFLFFFFIYLFIDIL